MFSYKSPRLLRLPPQLRNNSNTPSFFLLSHTPFCRFSTTIPKKKTMAAAQEYKLKGVSSLDLSPGHKEEVEVEGVEDGKVLLVNAAGTVQAVGAKCTHYGAPLVKGVLTKSGRLTCPWHGGTFLPSRPSLHCSDMPAD